MNFYEKYHSDPKLQKRIISNHNFTYRNLLSVLNKHLKSSKKILDVGCGVGTIDFYLASKGNRVTGLDISKSAISIAKENANFLKVKNNTNFLVSDFPKSKVTGRYDFLMMLEVIEHLPYDKKAIEECYKVLKNKGIIIISTRSKNEVLHKLGLEKTHDIKVGHLRRYSADDLRTMLIDSGFKVLKIYKTEGVLRDSFFVFSIFGDILVRFANKFKILSNILTFLDNIFLKLFGESQIYIVAKK